MATARMKTRSKAAAKPPSRKIENPEQYERFREFAREHETDDDPQKFDQKFRKVVQSKH
jgi:hypothetical protein